MEISAIILAGGKSSRMGQDKGLMIYNGKPLIQYAIDILKPLTNDLIIVSNKADYQAFGYKTIDDIYLEKGPLVGIYSGLQQINNDWCFVLSCDAPNLTSDILLSLTNNINTSEVIVAEHKTQIHPLIGLYNKSCLSKLKMEIELDQLGLIKAIKKCRYKTVDFSTFPEQIFKNINSPSDL